MRTLLVTFDYPPMLGGIATVFGTLWPRAGHDGSLILAPRVAGWAKFDAGTGVRTYRFPVVAGKSIVAKAINTASCAVWFAVLAARFRPDVVIAGQIRRAGPLAHGWSRITGKCFDLWVYGGETSPDFTASTRSTRYLQSILLAARFLFTNSPFTSGTMIDFGIPAARVVEIPLGVREDLRPAPKDPAYVERFGLHEKLVFLSVGRLIERKGIDTMLEALAGLDDHLPPWRYLIVSDGPYRRSLEQLTRHLDLQERVVFTGYVDDDELPIYYNLCDIFAMPNREVRSDGASSLSVEGFGMVFIDAAACGKPVIGGRSGGAVHAVDDGVNGLLVEPGDVDGLRRAILELTDPELRARMGRAGIELAARFTWDRAAEKLRPYLDEDPAKGRGAAP